LPFEKFVFHNGQPVVDDDLGMFVRLHECRLTRTLDELIGLFKVRVSIFKDMTKDCRLILLAFMLIQFCKI